MTGKAPLDEPPGQRYVGRRDLTAWPSAAGRRLVAVAVRLHERMGADRVLTLALVLGLLVVAAGVLGAGELYDAVTESEGVAGLDRPVLEGALALRAPTLTAVAQGLAWLGGPTGMPVLATLTALGLAWRWRQWTPVVLVAVTAAGSLTLTVVGKALVGRSRPPLADAVPPYELGASFPSGHTLNAVAIAGVVAYLLVRRQGRASARALTILLATLFALAMAASRIYLGHHWLTDVLVAWSLGVAWLAVVVTSHRLYLTLRRQQGFVHRIA